MASEPDGLMRNEKSSESSLERNECDHEEQVDTNLEPSDDWSSGTEEEYRPTRSRASQSHRKYKSKSGSHLCVKCGAKFRKKEILKNHMLVHSHFKPHKCPLCTAQFKRKGDFNRHISMHERTKDRTHVCVTCKKTFLKKTEYTRHLLTHSNLFPFKCKECHGKFFASSQALKKHMGRVDEGCGVCSMQFTCKVSLKRHIASHQNKLCDSCGLEINSKEMDAHIAKVHASVEPFACGHCRRAFKTKFELVRHQTIHSVLNAFHCKICTEEFRTKAQLKKHSLVHSTSFTNGALTASDSQQKHT